MKQIHANGEYVYDLHLHANGEYVYGLHLLLKDLC